MTDITTEALCKAANSSSFGDQRAAALAGRCLLDGLAFLRRPPVPSEYDTVLTAHAIRLCWSRATSLADAKVIAFVKPLVADAVGRVDKSREKQAPFFGSDYWDWSYVLEALLLAQHGGAAPVSSLAGELRIFYDEVTAKLAQGPFLDGALSEKEWYGPAIPTAVHRLLALASSSPYGVPFATASGITLGSCLSSLKALATTPISAGKYLGREVVPDCLSWHLGQVAAHFPEQFKAQGDEASKSLFDLARVEKEKPPHRAYALARVIQGAFALDNQAAKQAAIKLVQKNENLGRPFGEGLIEEKVKASLNVFEALWPTLDQTGRDEVGEMLKAYVRLCETIGSPPPPPPPNGQDKGLMSKNAQLVLGLVGAALAAFIAWLVFQSGDEDVPTTPPASAAPRFEDCAAKILMKDVRVKRENSAVLGSLMASLMKPQGGDAGMELKSDESHELKTVLDKVPTETVKAVLDGCKDAQHFQQARVSFKGKFTAIYEENGNHADGVQILAVSDRGQQCKTDDGACTIPLEGELLARQIDISVYKRGFVVVGGTYNKLKVSPISVQDDGVQLVLRRWPRLNVQVTRKKKAASGATLHIMGATFPPDTPDQDRVHRAELWPAGCVDFQKYEAKEDCPAATSNASGIVAFDTPELPLSISVIVDGAPAIEVPIENGQARIELVDVKHSIKCATATVAAVKNELSLQHAKSGKYTFTVDPAGKINGTTVSGLRPLEPGKHKLPCSAKTEL